MEGLDYAVAGAPNTGATFGPSDEAAGRMEAGGGRGGVLSGDPARNSETGEPVTQQRAALPSKISFFLPKLCHVF